MEQPLLARQDSNLTAEEDFADTATLIDEPGVSKNLGPEMEYILSTESKIPESEAVNTKDDAEGNTTLRRTSHFILPDNNRMLIHYLIPNLGSSNPSKGQTRIRDSNQGIGTCLFLWSEWPEKDVCKYMRPYYDMERPLIRDGVCYWFPCECYFELAKREWLGKKCGNKNCRGHAVLQGGIGACSG